MFGLCYFRSMLLMNWAALPHLGLELLLMQLPSDLEQLSLENNPCELVVH